MKTARTTLREILDASDEEKLESGIWCAAAEIEYASATISLHGELEDFDPIERRPKLKSKSIQECLKESICLIDESIDRLDDDIRVSYANLRMAVSLLRAMKPPPPQYVSGSRARALHSS